MHGVEDFIDFHPNISHLVKYFPISDCRDSELNTIKTIFYTYVGMDVLCEISGHSLFLTLFE